MAGRQYFSAISTFREMLAETEGKTIKNEDAMQAAALLTIADAIANHSVQFDDSFGHEICMGIRHGLFGGDASDRVSLHDIDFV